MRDVIKDVEYFTRSKDYRLYFMTSTQTLECNFSTLQETKEWAISLLDQIECETYGIRLNCLDDGQAWDLMLKKRYNKFIKQEWLKVV